MTEAILAGARDQEPSVQRKGRGPTKPYPSDKFESCLTLAMAIREHGFEDSIRRVTVLQRLGRDYTSRSTRDLITNAHKYGLITGNYKSENLALTEAGRSVVGARSRPAEFALAVEGVVPFKALYDRLKERRIPAMDVLENQVTGVPDANRRECATLFLENARYIGLVYNHLGSDHIRTLEHAMEEYGDDEQGQEEPAPQSEPPGNVVDTAEHDWARASDARAFSNSPNVHMDINIHIDANASPDVIDQVFASMARHLYNRE